jgi:hypothetical protein
MTRGSSLWHDIEQQADRLLALVQSTAYAEPREMPQHYGLILGMFWRCLRLYDAALLLIKGELPEEAAFLARSLFEESLWLQQLNEDAAGRTALILWWANRSIREKRNLMKVARSIGLDNDIDGTLASLDKSQRKLDDYAARHGVTRLRAPRSPRDGAVRYGRRDDFWTYQWSHESVHGSEVAYMFSRRKIAEGTAGFHAKTGDPEIRATMAEFAARSITDATVATFAIFGWTLPADFRESAARMQAILEEHGRRKADSENDQA